jgi:hypothetical protein
MVAASPTGKKKGSTKSTPSGGSSSKSTVSKEPGKIKIKADPPGKVYVDGKLVGEGSEVVAEVKAGKHSVKLSAGGGTVRRSVKIKGGQSQTVYLKIRKGELEIDAPAGATVYVDGKKKGTTPIGALQLTAGSHTILVQKGKAKYRRKVSVKADLIHTLTVEFHSN